MATRGTVYLGVRDGTDGLFADRITRVKATEGSARATRRLPLHRTGGGRVLLAYSPDAWNELCRMGERDAAPGRPAPHPARRPRRDPPHRRRRLPGRRPARSHLGRGPGVRGRRRDRRLRGGRVPRLAHPRPADDPPARGRGRPWHQHRPGQGRRPLTPPNSDAFVWVPAGILMRKCGCPNCGVFPRRLGPGGDPLPAEFCYFPGSRCRILLPSGGCFSESAHSWRVYSRSPTWGRCSWPVPPGSSDSPPTRAAGVVPCHRVRACVVPLPLPFTIREPTSGAPSRGEQNFPIAHREIAKSRRDCPGGSKIPPRLPGR